MTTSNCTFCKYGGSWTGKGKGHCYMFKEEPQGVCEKHTGNKVQPDKSEPVAIRHSWDGNGWLYTDSGSGSGWRDSINQPGAEFVYVAPKVASDYVPMSDEQWQALQDETGEIWSSFTRNAVERAVRGAS